MSKAYPEVDMGKLAAISSRQTLISFDMNYIRSSSVFRKVAFEEMTMTGCYADDLVFDNCSFQRCNWSDNVIRNCQFVDCSFDESRLKETVFKSCRIKKTEFSNCHVLDTIIDDSVVDDVRFVCGDIGNLCLLDSDVGGLFVSNVSVSRNGAAQFKVLPDKDSLRALKEFGVVASLQY